MGREHYSNEESGLSSEQNLSWATSFVWGIADDIPRHLSGRSAPEFGEFRVRGKQDERVVRRFLHFGVAGELEQRALGAGRAN